MGQNPEALGSTVPIQAGSPGAPVVPGLIIGDTLYWDGSVWQRLAPGLDGFQLTTHDVGLPPTWEAGTVAPVTSVFGRVGAVVALAADYAAFYPPLTRLLTAGAGFTVGSGGDLSADRTFTVGANADGSIVVNANDVQVGVLATDAQHGVRGGDTQHTLATALAAGFFSPADFTKLAGIGAGAGSPMLSWGNNSVSATTTTRYLEPWFDDTLAPTSATQYRVLRAGTLTNARVRHNVAAGNGNAIDYILRVNNVASALSISLASTTQDSAVNASTVAVVAGDLLDVEVTKAASVGTSPTNCLFMCEFQA